MNESAANNELNTQKSYLIYTYKTSLRSAAKRSYPIEPDYQATIMFSWGNKTKEGKGLEKVGKTFLSKELKLWGCLKQEYKDLE